RRRARSDLQSVPTRRSSDLHDDREGSLDGRAEPGNITCDHVNDLAVGGVWSARDEGSGDRAFAWESEGECARCPEFAFDAPEGEDRKSTRLNSSHVKISYAV